MVGHFGSGDGHHDARIQGFSVHEAQNGNRLAQITDDGQVVVHPIADEGIDGFTGSFFLRAFGGEIVVLAEPVNCVAVVVVAWVAHPSEGDSV